MNITAVRPINDGEDVRLLQESIHLLVRPECQFKSKWITQHRWVVVPRIEHIDHEEARLISLAARNFGHESCVAVRNEDLANVPACYHVPTTIQGIWEFSDICTLLGFFSFVLMPRDRSFAVLTSSAGDYYLIGGDTNFVEEAVGTSIATARKDFEQYANNHEIREIGTMLLKMARRYYELSQEA